MGAVVGNTFYFGFEVALMEWLQRTLGETGCGIASFFSSFGEELVLILILTFLYWCYDKKLGEYIGSVIVLGLVINPLIKNIFWRRRPYFDHESIKCFRPVEKDADIYDIAAQGFSFPSGHSTNAAAAYGSIASVFRKRAVTIVSCILILLVGFSRVCVGVHYPTDVLCGWLSGFLCIFIVSLIRKKISDDKTWLMYLIIFLISCLGLLYCKTSDYFSSLGLMGGTFAAFEFEKRFVNFKNTKNPLACVLRILGGVIIYFVLNTVLKMPFSSEFLHSGTFQANLVRAVRYTIVAFVDVGLFPMTFKYADKLFKAPSTK